MDDVVEPLKPRGDGRLYADDLTAAQFLAVMDTFIETQHSCPVCDTRHWEVQQEDDGRPVLLYLPSFRDETDKLLSFFMTCSTCGFVRTHLAQHICRLAGKL
jgi:hypothetical protein